MTDDLAISIAALQAEYFAEDLVPQIHLARHWSDSQLHSFFQNGGAAEPVLAAVAGDVVPMLLDAGIFTLDELVVADLSRIDGLTVGARTRLRLAQSHEYSYSS